MHQDLHETTVDFMHALNFALEFKLTSLVFNKPIKTGYLPYSYLALICVRKFPVEVHPCSNGLSRIETRETSSSNGLNTRQIDGMANSRLIRPTLFYIACKFYNSNV